MKIFQLIDLITRLFKLNKRSKVVLLFLVPTFLLGQNNGAFWLGKRASATGETDPFFSDVSLLLHMDGANNSTTFTDNSINNFTVTPFGNAKISTAQSKFGGASLYLDGNGDFLVTPVDNNLYIGLGDFTIECWFYAQTGSTSANMVLTTLGPYNQDYPALIGLISGIDYYAFISSAGTSWNIANPVIIINDQPLNEWCHFAFTREGNILRFFKNGILQNTLNTSLSIYQGQNQITIGNGQTSRFWSGYIDEFRITKGVARYTSNFTPPTAPFPNN